MNLGDATAFMSTILGFRKDQTANAQIALGAAQEHYENGPIRPWFLLSETLSIVTAIGERRLPMPADFLAESDESSLFYSDDEEDEFELVKRDYDYLIKTIGNKASGLPTSYSTDGVYFNLFPTPDNLYSLKAKMYRKDVSVSTLSASDTNKWLTFAPNCLIGWAGANLATGLRDNVALARFQNLESTAQDQLNRQTEERKHVNRSYQIGGPHI